MLFVYMYEENELILASVLQGLYDVVALLLREALENLDLIFLCIDEIVDQGKSGNSEYACFSSIVRAVLPPELGELKTLKVLGADYNMLVSVPVELRQCVRLVELALEHNTLDCPLLDFSAMTELLILSLCTGQDYNARLVDMDMISMISSDNRHVMYTAGMVANNPSIFTIREAQLLWPDTKIDGLVSISCGSFTYKGQKKGGWCYVDTGQVLIESACSVDRV
ncbi:hypothetical protein COLO4_06246 [Corchorus olitorius]|uniref:Uncharacterized protein n=1 Tax=Corchorus olitorius TaxID=93759 RepID=A0A1R3KNJ0_9ROSI|nr:hypothetical protein COLO4_06246 [Corchorus olitorius]